MTTCPYLVPVVADRLWLMPQAAFCRRPDAHRRLVAACTFWPARSGCRQDCLTEPMHELLDTGSARPSPARQQA